MVSEVQATGNVLNVPSQYLTIQSAIDAAQNGDIVEIAAGTYNDVINFNGKMINVRGAGINQTILDGGGIGTVVYAQSGETTDTILEGLTVTGGQGSAGPFSQPSGGGIYVESSITIRNVLITGNSSYWGGAISFFGSNSTSILDNVVVTGNSGMGSVIQLDDYNNVLFKNSIISSNNAEGAIIGIWRSGATFENVIIENNAVGNYGYLININFNNGLYDYPNLPVTIQNSIVRNNNVGNVISSLFGYARILINKSEFSGNVTSTGLFWPYRTFLEIHNSTLSGNSNTINTDDTGSVYNAIFNLWALDSIETDGYYLLMNNTIVWGNSSPSGVQLTFPSFGFNSPLPININYNILQGGWADPNSLGILDMDPLFVDSANGDYHLTLSSPAIDSGDPNSPLDPDGTRADMGAYPFFQVPTPSAQVEDLIDTVESFNLQQGINNSLDAKLDAALNALDDLNENNDQAAINSLQAFINAVEAQRGSQITNEQADELVNRAQEIINTLSS
ncbi:hypothetical protein HYZ78_03120 [Candidatus Microgenomates bacterium]|nr:hypothetical protein [Candidatus Microgenomates bacterium]